MLNRNDLAKQFELVVQQEIKNHNDSLLATNLSINQLNSDLKLLSDRHNKDFACLSGHVKRLDMQFDKLSQALNELLAALTSQFTDLSINSYSRLQKMQDTINSFNDYYQTKKDSNDQLNETKNKLTSLKDQICEQWVNTYNNILNFSMRCKEDLNHLRTEILDKPSEATQVKKDLEKQLAEASIDFSGLKREISIGKKELFIIQKKIENIYTLIERIKCPKQD